jgi:predicted RNA binding protein YcfA (HicA-like mRNA interferase family)
MPKLKPTKPKDLVKVLKKIGFVESRTKGSHLIMKNSDNLLVVIPLHNKEIPTGTLLAIINDSGLSKENFLKLLND